MAVTQYPTKSVRVSVPVHDELLALQAREETRRQRNVPLGELVEMLIQRWKETEKHDELHGRHPQGPSR